MYKDFSIGQHDVIEFLRIIFNDLIKENNLNLIKAAYKELDSEGLDKKQLSIKYADYFRSREDSFINNLFYIQLINIYICNCGFETYSFQKLCDLPLLLPQGYKEIDLLTIIKYNFSDYVEDWIEICKGCKRKNISHKKNIYLNILSDFQLFSFQRFNKLLNTKNNVLISFNEKLDISKFYDGIGDLNSIRNYNLFATVNHYGDINQGHYD